jgi:gliding motility-associated-like protein
MTTILATSYSPLRFVKIFLFIFLGYFTGYAQNSSLSQRTFNLPAGSTTKDYMPGIIILKFRSTDAASAKKQASPEAINALLISIKNVKIESVTKKFPTPDNAQQTESAGGLDRIYEIKFSGTAGIEEIVNELLKNNQVEYAEPSYIYHSDYIPNDPSFSANQDYLNQVKAPQAWDLIRNASNVIIGIIDSGSDLTHPDLAPNIYINAADPVDGIDNDGDGYTDNNKGWDLIGLSGANPKGDNDPSVKSDSTAHGVHVSGLASAVSNNSLGIASIASNAKLLIVKVGADDNGSTVYLGYEGIKYAADHGAKIINCSWGGYTVSSMGQDIVNYALSKDCLIIAAAGNDNSALNFYPASYPGVISVASVSNNDIKSSFSNYGPKVSISAPGNNIYSTLLNNTYGSFSGTSMATPLVSSAAALVKAWYPALSMQEVGQLLIYSADDISASNSGYLGRLGSGRLNVFNALQQNLQPSIVFPAFATKIYGDADFDAGATANSALPINYSSSNTQVATIVNGKIHITGAGTTTITASINGNVSFTQVQDVSRSLRVNKAPQTITFDPIPIQIRGGTPYALKVSASSGLPIALGSLDPFTVTVTNGNLNPLRVGRATVTASQLGNVNYQPATGVIQNVQIVDADGSIVKIWPAVSPNNDGINDYLIIEGIGDYAQNHVTVFTGNGVPVFETENYDNTDHIFKGISKNGSKLPKGSYFYLLQFVIDGKQARKTGYFVLKY